MKKISQKYQVLNRLTKQKYITTKQAQNIGINRLAVMIERLRKDGYEIDTIYPVGIKPGRYELKI